MKNDIILATEDLTKEFAGFVAVSGVNLEVARGSIHALIGPNGAGKTTCFNLLTKFLQPTRGRILFKGARHHRHAAGRRRAARPGALVPDLGRVSASDRAGERAHRPAAHSAAPRSISGARNGARTHSTSARRRSIADVGLTAFADWTAVELPYGRKRALEIATTLALDPEMLLLDEPMAGMGHEDIDRIGAADQAGRGRPHRADGRTQSLRWSPICPTTSPCSRAGACSPKATTPPCRPTRKCAKPIWEWGMLDMTAPLLAIKDLQAWYGEFHILHGVTFDVCEGEVVTLLGRNGAGKTTTLKSIMGIVSNRTGSVRFEGRELIGLSSDRIARAGIAFCPEERGIFASLGVEENLLLPPVVRPGGLSLDQIFDLFPNLKERLGSNQGTKLSGGEQQMLAIGRILRTGARLLLLDEPTEGLAPVIIQQIGKTIKALKEQGFTILLVEQNFRFASTVADRYYVMEHGRIIDRFANAELDANVEKLHDYLGV